jgi:DNA gyrase subunit A
MDKKPETYINRNITTEVKESFLDYAMSVIISRALPDVRDGLKPVHRRIIYAMHTQGMYAKTPHKKSARIVGEVIGKYHPHGDSAVYESMVRMAQTFNFRYPLIDGHGNFGSIDGDSAAAMRYTEARMSKITGELLKDIRKNTVDYQKNYDENEEEPVVLPAKFPNLLVNGTTGIAVGMATNIPPHNLGEIIDATVLLIDSPEATIEDLMIFVKAPDFPTGGLILGTEGVNNAYRTGRGSVLIRSKTRIIETKGKEKIIIEEIPFQVNKSKLIEKIADLARSKEVEGITDLRDESNKDGIRIVIEVSRNHQANVILNHLFKKTPLQSSFGMNMISLVDNEPKMLTLKSALEYYIKHQYDVLVRQVTFDLNKAKEREHIIAGLIIALKNIDRVIQIIRGSQTTAQAKEALEKEFKLTQIQCDAILEMRLQRLTGLEREKLEAEHLELLTQIEELNGILASREIQSDIIKKDLIEIKEKYSDERRSQIQEFYSDLDEESLIQQEKIVVTLTRNGYVKRSNVDTYKLQKRGGVGVKGAVINEDDQNKAVIYTDTHSDLLCFTNQGRVYKMRAHKIPVGSRVAKGIPLLNIINIQEDEEITNIVPINISATTANSLAFVTKNGLYKKTPIESYARVQKNGLKAIKLREGDSLINVFEISEEDEVFITASNGRSVRFENSQTRELSRNSSGVKAITLEEGDQVIGGFKVTPTDNLLVISENGYGKITPISEFRITKRGARGIQTMKITEKTGNIKAVKAIELDENQELIVTTERGMVVRTPIKDINVISRVTQGVKIVNLKENNKVTSIEVIVPEEEVETEETTN